MERIEPVGPRRGTAPIDHLRILSPVERELERERREQARKRRAKPPAKRPDGPPEGGLLDVRG
jgi:hypothetical protein